MIMQTKYRTDGDCTTLVNHLHDGTQEKEGVRNTLGKLMAQDEREEWINWSKHQMMQRLIILSPHPSTGREMTNEEFSLNTRETMNEYLRDKPEARYVFAVHRNPSDPEDVPHVQVAMAGNDDSVKMYDRRREQLSDIAAEAFNDERPS
jgi:hypothetical protein